MHNNNTQDSRLPQDLHIHTVFSEGDTAIVPQQTAAFIAEINHARVAGISDHIEFITGPRYPEYQAEVRRHGFKLGVEVARPSEVADASGMNVDYYVYHCANQRESYDGLESLLSTGKPVIVAHPLIMETDLNKVPRECFIEISNRYAWRSDWRKGFAPFITEFRFVISSDSHYPSALCQRVARYIASELGIKETILF